MNTMQMGSSSIDFINADEEDGDVDFHSQRNHLLVHFTVIKLINDVISKVNKDE